MVFATQGLSAALHELNVDQGTIDKVVGILTSTSDDIGGGQFANDATIAPAEFGARPTAEALGLHHAKAHQVMQATIDAMAQDLMTFAQGAKTAIGYVEGADEQSAADLAKAQAAVEQMSTVATNSHSDNAYDDARNNPNQPAPGPGADDTTDEG